MSTYHQHVIWESSNGTWGIGFFERIDTNYNNNPEYDSEWDDAYSDNSFVWAKTGFRTPALAVASSLKEFRPGYEAEELHYEDAPEMCEDFDLMALHVTSPELAEKIENEKIDNLNRAHADKVSAYFLENNLTRKKVIVHFKEDKKVYDKMGFSVVERGWLTTEGNILTIGGRPVFDLSTGRIASNIHSIAKY